MQQPSSADKFRALLKWVEANGGSSQGIDVPVRFPSGEVGVAASADLPARTAIMCIPSRCILSVRKSLQSDLKPIFDRYEHMFSMEKVSDAEFNILAMYLFYEMLKKEQSFYYPYLQCLPHEDFTMIDWPENSVAACRSPYLKSESSFVRDELLRIFQQIKQEILTTEELFTRLNCSEEELTSTFLRAYNIVMTRCYGWSLPSTCLIPLADMCNHNDVQNSTHYIVHKKHQTCPEDKPKEYILKRDSLDLSIMGIPAPAIKPVKKSHKYKYITKFIKKHHTGMIHVEPDVAKPVLDQMVAAIESEQCSGAQRFLDLKLYHTSDQEDNDTDSDEKEKKLSIMTDLRLKEIQMNKNRKAKKLLLKKPSTEAESEGFERNPHEQHIEIEPVLHQQNDSDASDNLEQAQWDWLEETDPQWYFVVTTQDSVQKGEQIYNNYGERTNRFLMMWYGFCPDHNKYDSYSFRVELDSAERWPLHELPEHMLSVGWMQQQLRSKDELTQVLRLKNLSKEFRLKSTAMCLDFVRFLRMWLLRLYKNFDEIRCFQIPTSVSYEIFVFEFYLLVLVHILDGEFSQKEPTQPPATHFHMFAHNFRTSQHRIVHEQRNFVRECLNILVNLQKGAKLEQFIRVVPVENLRGILPYLKELEQYI